MFNNINIQFNLSIYYNGYQLRLRWRLMLWIFILIFASNLKYFHCVLSLDFLININFSIAKITTGHRHLIDKINAFLWLIINVAFPLRYFKFRVLFKMNINLLNPTAIAHNVWRFTYRILCIYLSWKDNK